MNVRLSVPPTSANAWLAELSLGFAARDGRTLLHENRHAGPLRVQKALYPEGDAVCQAIVLHPPSGIAGGDHLAIKVKVDDGAFAQLTTPGAGKWYRSGGAEASQQLDFTVGEGATLEWLPQESIVFDGAIARMATRVSLAADSRFIGWDILCLGRAAAGERFTQGKFELFLRVDRAPPPKETCCAAKEVPLGGGNLPLWIERGGFTGGDAMLHSPAGWAGATVNGTLLCSFPELAQAAPALLEALRAVAPPDAARHGITVLPGILIARYLGDNSEAARLWFAELWKILRPACCSRPAVLPRIWNT